MIDIIELYNSVILIGDFVFRFVRFNKKELVLKNGEF